jgi:PhoH-like ATPase
VTYIRGRSLPKLFILIDEAQNLSPHEVKTIVSRAGQDSKVVLAGDPFQIDNPYLDASSNGLSTLVEAFREQPLFGHIWLDKSERSDLASLAAELL